MGLYRRSATVITVRALSARCRRAVGVNVQMCNSASFAFFFLMSATQNSIVTLNRPNAPVECNVDFAGKIINWLRSCVGSLCFYLYECHYVRKIANVRSYFIDKSTATPPIHLTQCGGNLKRYKNTNNCFRCQLLRLSVRGCIVLDHRTRIDCRVIRSPLLFCNSNFLTYGKFLKLCTQ